MKKGVLYSAAFAVAICTAAVTNDALAQSEQLDAQTAELLDLIGGDVEQASFDAASTLEFNGGELQGVEDKGCVGSCCPPTWVGGVDVTFLRPHVHGSRYQRSIAEVQGERVTSDQHALTNMTFAPRIWFGKQGECWGLITRFWYVSDSNMYYDPYQGPALNDTDTSTAGNRIKAYTVDLEVNRRFDYRCWNMNLGFGVRHASLEVDTMASFDRFNNPPNAAGVNYTSSAFTKSGISGTGLTLGLNGQRLISDCYNVSAFWGLRGSVVWGNATQRGSAVATVTDYGAPNGFDSQIASSYQSSNEALFIGEVQLGLIWEQRLSCLPANVFVKIAAEYQYWDASASQDPIWDGARAEVNQTFAFPQYDAAPPNIGLFGFNLGIGLTWGGCSN